MIIPEDLKSIDLSRVPSEYHHLQSVFCKERATVLPPHRSYDCAVELLPGACPPRGRIFSLSSPEQKAMEAYINESLAAGIIRPSTLLAGPGFFFVEKDGGLRPCIDYRALNRITVRNHYPLPLITSAFELLQDAKIFSKLLFAHSSCTSLFILLFIKSTVYCIVHVIAHLTPYFFFLF